MGFLASSWILPRIRFGSAKLVAGGLLACGLVGAVLPPEARGSEEDSKTLFAKGRDLRLKGDCKGALPLFQKAFEIYPDGLGALRNLAECQEETKLYASARRSYWDLRRAALGTVESKYEGWANDAETAYQRIEPKVPHVRVHIKVAPETARVVINGQPLDKRLLDTDLEEDVGELVVVLEDGTASPPKKTLQIEEGKHYDVELESTAPPQKKPPVDSGPSGPSPLLVAGGVSVGLAGLALGGLIGSVVIRQNALDEVESQCPGFTGCDGSLRDAVDRGELTSSLVNAFSIATGVFGALGLSLIVADVVVSPSSAEKAALPATIALTANPYFIGLSVGGPLQ
ncbi:MAG: tetratricopeptide repeat protein [Polyangiaceae bacterium]